MTEPKFDCLFYGQEHDMGATIPYCEKHGDCFDCSICLDYRYNSDYLNPEYYEDMGKTIWVEHE